MYLPKEYTKEVIRDYYNNPLVGYLGVSKIVELLQ